SVAGAVHGDLGQLYEVAVGAVRAVALVNDESHESGGRLGIDVEHDRIGLVAGVVEALGHGVPRGTGGRDLDPEVTREGLGPWIDHDPGQIRGATQRKPEGG